ncbi:MAG: iron-containing redox enzyme family protein [Pseudomonadota bacterium]
MNRSDTGQIFVRKLSDYALNSQAVNHPYLHAMSRCDFPDVDFAFKDFAFQYGLYSAGFTRYVSAIIDQLSSPAHRQILKSNLEEEQGHAHDLHLPAEVMASVDGVPHAKLFRRFQEALGVDTDYRNKTEKSQTAVLWGRQFLRLCETDEYVGIGAIGIGTELIVARIYNQILQGLEMQGKLSRMEHVFFDLHSECDEEHAAQIELIAADLANSDAACEQIEFGARMAIFLRTLFWDKMFQRAMNFSDLTTTRSEEVSAVGY